VVMELIHAMVKSYQGISVFAPAKATSSSPKCGDPVCSTEVYWSMAK
jgi:hypothetical protein